MYAVRLHAAETEVTIISNAESVTHRCTRYIRPWWNISPITADSACTAPLIRADVDPAGYANIAGQVAASDHTSVSFAGDVVFVARDDDEGVVTAVSPAPCLAYRSETHAGRLAVYGRDAERVATAAAVMARAAMHGVLVRTGWTALRAAAVARDDRVVLALGAEGAGKTTAATALAARGWNLLADDRVFARLNEWGDVRILTSPAAVSLGLGLLDALGWYSVARERLRSGESMHPTQDRRVTEALLAGRRKPLWDGARELKVRFFPQQLPAWFDVTMATGGQAATLLFPQIEPGAAPARAKVSRALEDGDFVGETDDYDPDVFGLAGGVANSGNAEARSEIAERLALLPRHAVTLGHDLAASGDLLVKVAGA